MYETGFIELDFTPQNKSELILVIACEEGSLWCSHQSTSFHHGRHCTSDSSKGPTGSGPWNLRKDCTETQ